MNKKEIETICNENKNKNVFYCKTCGKLISKRAKSCPNCGEPNKNIGDWMIDIGKAGTIFVFGIIAILFLLFFLLKMLYK